MSEQRVLVSVGGFALTRSARLVSSLNLYSALQLLTASVWLWLWLWVDDEVVSQLAGSAQ